MYKNKLFLYKYLSNIYLDCNLLEFKKKYLIKNLFKKLQVYK